ncbi:MAG: cyclic nucleotide-binding domain-containing protein, partial [SAR324 cluster bacterium]|nr:cyclic nucleotide-binding domain-containing protein [SAR324 cluster bacterium]
MKEQLSKIQLVEIIKKEKVFQQFEDSALLELVELSLIEHFMTGDVIIPENIENDKIYLIIDGEVDVFADGGYILTLRRQGDLIGEMSVISKNPTTAEVRARTEISLFSISDSLIRSKGSVEVVLLLNKICLDILTYKLTKTTDKAKDFDNAYHDLTMTQAELAESQGDLKVSTGILNSVLESMSDGVVVTDEQGFVLLHNHAFADIVGIKEIPREVTKWSKALGFYESDEKTYLGADSIPAVHIKKLGTTAFKDVFVKNENRPTGIWIQASSNKLDLGLISEEHGAVTVIRDVTAKRLERDSLIKAKEEAENAAQAKTNFLSVMS